MIRHEHSIRASVGPNGHPLPRSLLLSCSVTKRFLEKLSVDLIVVPEATPDMPAFSLARACMAGCLPLRPTTSAWPLTCLSPRLSCLTWRACQMGESCVLGQLPVSNTSCVTLVGSRHVTCNGCEHRAAIIRIRLRKHAQTRDTR